MSVRIDYRPRPHWPPLAWLARCGEGGVVVDHGRDVETDPNGFCEAAWDLHFEAFDFDRADAFFGSGARLRDDGLRFVSSHSTVDRLHDLRREGEWLVSNSLACLAHAAGAKPDPWYPWYYEDFHSIACGIDDYAADGPFLPRGARLTYWRDLHWDGRALQVVDKPAQQARFDDYESYVAQLRDTLRRLADNMSSRARRAPYTPLSTASSGYDALAVSVLARDAGVREAICATDDRIGRDDSAVKLVERIGMTPLAISREHWRAASLDPVPFIAGDASGRDTWIAPMGERLSRCVLFTGNYGDIAWSIVAGTSRARLARSMRTGCAGLSLAEYRLHAGFIHCPVPYIGIDAVETMRSISASPAMAPWRVGGRYDRPLPRRIIESAGIERGQFARYKTATAVHLFHRQEFERFLAGSDAFHDFMRWIRRVSRESPHDGQPVPLTSPAREHVQTPLFRHLYPWALERCMAAYADEASTDECSDGDHAANRLAAET